MAEEAEPTGMGAAGEEEPTSIGTAGEEEPKDMEMEAPASVRLGEKSTSDVVVRLRTEGGSRDEWFYCHSQILARKSRYFADRLSLNWPTCQILDSRTCVDLLSAERDFDSHVSALRLLYSPPSNLPAAFHNVRNALGILRVAINLGCEQLVDSCFGFLEASPWDEAEEEEILRSVPALGSQYQPILARLQPVDLTSVVELFISALRLATLNRCVSPHMRELRSSVQEQIEYMLTEDDDVPLLNSSDLFKAEVKKCTGDLITKFDKLLECLQNYTEEEPQELEALSFRYLLFDFTWVCQILAKIELMKDVVHFWVDASTKILKAVEVMDELAHGIEIKLKVVVVTTKVLEAIGYGHVILPTMKRVETVKVWLPFVRCTKDYADFFFASCDDDGSFFNIDDEAWQNLESALVSVILALPSGEQALILSDWLKDQFVRYPDLSEAFEIWCYRHKVARRRMTLLDGCSGVNGEDRDL